MTKVRTLIRFNAYPYSETGAAVIPKGTVCELVSQDDGFGVLRVPGIGPDQELRTDLYEPIPTKENA